VWLLGWSSLFTDAATEMIYPLLPVYLSRVLGAGAFSLGVIEGVAEAVNSGLRVASGYLSDRRATRRPIVIAGYALSSAVRPLIAFTSTWPQVLLIRALDRTGKGVRGAPRDAMLARFATAADRGRIFGFHRAMDHIGAIVGPLMAAAFLFASPGEYRFLFALTIVPGVVAVALLFFVHELPTAEPQSSPLPQMSEGASAAAAPVAWNARYFLTFLAILLIFSLGNSSDAFLLLRLSDAIGTAAYLPLLWSGLHVVKASLSTWGGSLSDRLGRRRIILIGWLVYAVVYLGFASTEHAATLVVWFVLYGVFFALTEGVEKALVADLAPESKHGLAFGLYNATLGVGTLAASVVFGLLYERFGAPVAFGTGSALAGAAAALLAVVPVPSEANVKIIGSNAPNPRNH
jgi:MFS family permease